MVANELLTRSQLKRLAEHKYNVMGTSLIEPYFQGFWCWTVKQLPLWWAPNMLTFVGLIINVVTTIILFFYSPDGKGAPPGWSLILCGAGLFIYQTLDAIDGKQARRTGSSSPLGELFDHGCDAVSIIFVIIGTCIAMQLGQTPWMMFFECFSTMFLFYAAHWQTYCSGVLKFGLVDVTEAQFSITLLYLISGILGVEIWNTQLPLLGIELKMLPLAYSYVGAILACYSNFYTIFMKGGVGKNGSTVAGTSVLSPLAPISFLIVLGAMIWIKSTTPVFREHIVLFILSFGIAAAKITNRLVIAHMSRTEMDIFDSTLLGPLLLFLNQYFDTYFSEFTLLIICFIFCTVDLVRYGVLACRVIADYLNIYIFSIEQRPGGPTIGATPPTAGTSSHGGAGDASHSRSSSSSSCDTNRPVLRSMRTHQH